MPATPTTENDPIDYVRSRLAGVPPKGLTRIAADNDISARTLTNIRDGRGARHTNVMKLYDFLKKTEAAPKKRAKK